VGDLLEVLLKSPRSATRIGGARSASGGASSASGGAL
jgi:hypothetical protein